MLSKIAYRYVGFQYSFQRSDIFLESQKGGSSFHAIGEEAKKGVAKKM